MRLFFLIHFTLKVFLRLSDVKRSFYDNDKTEIVFFKTASFFNSP